MGGTRRVDDVVAPCYACTGSLTQIYRFIKRQSAGIKFNLGKEGTNFDRRKEKKGQEERNKEA